MSFLRDCQWVGMLACSQAVVLRCVPLGHTPRFYRDDTKRQLQRALADLVEERKTPVIIIAGQTELKDRLKLQIHGPGSL